ncbi:MAG: hypothetical protein ABFC80_03840 [Coriobacteriales bacterium]
MSARQCFALCIDCWEMHYGICDKNGVYTRDSASSNHADHAVHVFGPPADYPPPIRTVLASLHAGLPVSDARMEMFSLACAIHALQPNNGISVAPPVVEAKERRAIPQAQGRLAIEDTSRQMKGER